MKPGNTLPAQIRALADAFDASFTCAVYDGDACLTEGAYGFADRASGRPMTLADTFCFSLSASWLLALAALRLADQKRLCLTQKLAAFYPDYPHGGRITLLHLLRSRSGIPDYIPAIVRRGYDADPAYRALSEDKRILRERQDAANFYDAETVLTLIGDMPLEYEPGKDDNGGDNGTGLALLAGALEKATGKPLFALIKELVFNPAGMDVTEGDTATTTCLGATQDGTMVFPLPRPEGRALPYTYTTDTASFVRLGRLLAGGGLVSPTAWKLVTRYAATESPLGLDNVDGSLLAYDESILGDSVRLFFTPGSGALACYLLNEQQRFRRIDGRMEYLCPMIRMAWEGALQTLTAPRMVRLNKQNIWSALDLRITPVQENFVMEAPDAIAFCMVDPHWKPYLLVDGTRAIGLLILTINHKKPEYEISIVLIDRRYQRRGYGRFMLEFAVETLKNAGAKKLEIGVNRENEAARRLYESLGFVPDRVYEGGLSLVKEDV